MSQSQRDADLEFIRQRCADTLHGGAKSALNELARDLAKQPLSGDEVVQDQAEADKSFAEDHAVIELEPDEPTPDGLDELDPELLEGA